MLMKKNCPLFAILLIFFATSCTTYNDIVRAQQAATSKAKEEQVRQMNLEWQTRDEYIKAAEEAWLAIENETDLKVFEQYLIDYYYGDIYYFLYEPALLKIAESFVNDATDANTIHFVHNYGLGLNPTQVLDTRKPEDTFIVGDIYVFDFLYLNRKSGNSLLADTAYWAPTELEKRIGVNQTEIFLRNIPTGCTFATRNWYVILRYVGDTRVFTVNGTDDIIETFDVLWFNPLFDTRR